MRVDVRYAGLDQDTERRVRLAALGLAVRGVHATASPWDGTRCDLLVANPADGYGRHVVEIARRRTISVVAIGSSSVDATKGFFHVASTASDGALVDALHAASTKMPRESTRAAERPALRGQVEAFSAASSGGGETCALVRLGSDAALARQDVEASIRGRTLWLLPSAGRVLTTSLSDQMGARERLAESGWEFKVLQKRLGMDPPGEIGTSLDAFYLQGALKRPASLPPVPAERYVLRMWPDLGAAPDLIDALKVVRALQRNDATPAEMSESTSLPLPIVSACLWAFLASGAVAKNTEDPAMPSFAPPQARSNGGLISRIAARFGLSWA